jgi:hypothetical protein
MGRIVGENKHKGALYPVDSKAIYRIIYEVVSVLPTENIKTSVIYCVPIIGKDNEYDMYLYIDGWSKIGSGSIDLSDYYKKAETNALLADKMDLASLNPTAAQIAAMPSGQLYGDTVNHKGVITNGNESAQEFYDTSYIDRLIIYSSSPPIEYAISDQVYQIGAIYMTGEYIYYLERIEPPVTEGGDYHYVWRRPVAINYFGSSPPNMSPRHNKWISFFQPNDIYIRENFSSKVANIFRCVSVNYDDNYFYYEWEQFVYTKTEIDTMIGDIETALSEV